MLKSKTVRETLKAKGYDLDKVETGKATVGQDLMRLLEKLAENKPVVSNIGNDKLENAITKRGEITQDRDSIKAGGPETQGKPGTRSGEKRYERRECRFRRKLKILD